MRRRLRILIVLASTFAMVLMLNVGVALADHGENAQRFEGATGLSVSAPVGTALGFPDPGTHKGLSGNFNGIDNNPNCPAHYLP